MTRWIAALATAALAGGAGIALAPRAGQAQGGSPVHVTSQEALASLHAMDQLDMQAGGLAEQRGGSPELRRFGDRIARDQRLTDRQVRAAAGHLGVPLVSTSPSESKQVATMDSRQLVQKLAAMGAGKQFDNLFLELMEQGNRQAIETLKAAQLNIRDREVRLLIARTLPILQQHVDLATLLVYSERRHG